MTDEEFMTLSIDEAEKHIQKRIDPQAAAAMETMIDSFSMQNDPHVGCFWYDTNTNSLFGVDAPLARDVTYYFSQEYNQNIKTGHMLQKKYGKNIIFEVKILDLMVISNKFRVVAFLSLKTMVLLFLPEVGSKTIQKQKKRFYLNSN